MTPGLRPAEVRTENVLACTLCDEEFKGCDEEGFAKHVIDKHWGDAIQEIVNILSEKLGPGYLCDECGLVVKIIKSRCSNCDAPLYAGVSP